MKIWHALKDTETGIAFSNSEGDDYPSREKSQGHWPEFEENIPLCFFDFRI